MIRRDVPPFPMQISNLENDDETKIKRITAINISLAVYTRRFLLHFFPSIPFILHSIILSIVSKFFVLFCFLQFFLRQYKRIWRTFNHRHVQEIKNTRKFFNHHYKQQWRQRQRRRRNRYDWLQIHFDKQRKQHSKNFTIWMGCKKTVKKTYENLGHYLVIVAWTRVIVQLQLQLTHIN